MSHNYIKQELRNTPFLLQFTDLHASNILVDEQWNVTGLIDLEWICALPLEMFDVPYWLTGCSVEQIKGEKFDEFDKVRRQFMRVFQEEEQTMEVREGDSISFSKVMQSMWQSKGVWFWHCLSSVDCMYFLLETHLYPPKSLSIEAERYVSRIWRWDSESIVKKKLEHRQT